MAKSKKFNFAEANEAGAEISDEEIKLTDEEEKKLMQETIEDLKVDKEILQERLENRGKVTPSIIREARELAATPTGMDIEKFFEKYRLVNVDIEQLLQAPLDKDGNYA